MYVKALAAGAATRHLRIELAVRGRREESTGRKRILYQGRRTGFRRRPLTGFRVGSATTSNIWVTFVRCTPTIELPAWFKSNSGPIPIRSASARASIRSLRALGGRDVRKPPASTSGWSCLVACSGSITLREWPCAVSNAPARQTPARAAVEPRAPPWFGADPNRGADFAAVPSPVLAPKCGM